MKIIILSPNAQALLTEDLLLKLKEVGNIFIESEIKHISEVKSLYAGEEERILAIDPDFCDWKVNNEDIDKVPNLKAVPSRKK